MKAVVLAVTCMLSIPAEAQTASDVVVSQYADFAKSRAAARWCLSEEARMQVERNERYNAVLRANAQDPQIPTIDEISEARAQVRLEDDALSQKREECTPLLDELVAAARELRRRCSAYAAPGNTEPAPPTDTRAIDICHGPAQSGTADKQ
jgi:hypothetical protein